MFARLALVRAGEEILSRIKVDRRQKYDVAEI